MKRLKVSLAMAFWLSVVTFPIMVIKINTINDTVIWRWGNLALIVILGLFGSYIWNYALDRMKERKGESNRLKETLSGLYQRLRSNPKVKKPVLAAVVLVIAAFPFITSMYSTSILTTALIYVVLGLGLNIIIGLGGLLHLGYAAFFAVGAYTYALLYQYFQIDFWIALPLGGLFAFLFGLLVGIPVLRLRGDYLAIVTLAFGEILRIILNNWGPVTGGPDGISRIPRPSFFGIDLKLQGSINLTYYIMVLMVVITIIVVRRLEDSRIGRALEAMKEDEVAAEAMGIDIMKSKLTAFALGSMWAGFAGVVMAAKTTKVTPDSFGLMESVIVLCIVVLGGMGSIPGILLGAFIFKIVMEYFRVFAMYRMLIFGAVLVIMMVFKPDGLIPKIRRKYTVEKEGA
ncbi:MAG: branched-chain amino acid ABC transporter permease [Spirochaetales bacterium]|nr:branched-chain amino acid ABC transporter permease [Spirochaetales bacterium]